MKKEVLITIPYPHGEEGVTTACRHGELFRMNPTLEKYFRQGYRVSDYEVTSGGGPGQNSTNIRVQLHR